MHLYAVTVTFHPLDREMQQDKLAGELFDELTNQAGSLRLEGPPSDRGADDDSFKMTIRLSADDEAEAKERARRALGTAVFAVHARHWIGRPGDTDPLETTRGLDGKQMQIDAAVIK